jgi:hypothetical protein
MTAEMMLDSATHTFPTIAQLSTLTEEEYWELGWGYRAPRMTKMLQQIADLGSEDWLARVTEMPYIEARNELEKLCGVGRKVADCICLFGLEHYGAIPVDTHCWQIASRYNYIPKAMRSTLTAKGHDAIGDEFRARFGESHAGWAFMVLFVAEVNPFTKRALHLPRTYPQRQKTVVESGSGGGGSGSASDGEEGVDDDGGSGSSAEMREYKVATKRKKVAPGRGGPTSAAKAATKRTKTLAAASGEPAGARRSPRNACL